MRLIILSLLLITACAKSKTNALLIKDCTGSYLRIGEKDYLISNNTIVENIETNTELDVSYNEVDEIESNEFVCLMYHEYKGIVEITKIK